MKPSTAKKWGRIWEVVAFLAAIVAAFWLVEIGPYGPIS